MTHHQLKEKGPVYLVAIGEYIKHDLEIQTQGGMSKVLDVRFLGVGFMYTHQLRISRQVL